METQNTEVTAHLAEESARKVPQSGFVRSRNRAMRWCDGRQRTGGSLRFRRFSRAGFNADLGRDPLATMRALTHKRTLLHPRTVDEETADYPALTKDFKNPAQEPRAHRFALEGPTHTLGWVVATLTILGVLTAMLMMGIAVSV
jgi:hypothetical protein